MKSESATELRKIIHGVSSTVGTLESIGRPITSSEDLFVFSVVDLLDSRTRREWENSVSDSPNPPTFVTLKRFLERRAQMLEALNPGKGESIATKSSETAGKTARTYHVQQKRDPGSSRCLLCKGDHALMVCSDFRGKSAQDRRQFVDTNHLCANCLGKHKINDCPSKRLCSVCSEKHHTSLHDAFRKASVSEDVVRTSHVAHSTQQRRTSVLLATARVRIADRYGNLQDARALIDQGSEATIITEKLAQRLRLPRQHTSVAVFGVGGQQTGVARGRVSISVWPRVGKTIVTTSALILPRLTGYPASSDAPVSEWSHIRGLELADPDLSSPDSIDVLLGADVYSSILCDGLRKGSRLQPVAQKTIFGWILSGRIRTADEEGITTHQCTVGESLSALVRRFWEQEELPPSPTPLTGEEQECEELFARTHTRTSEGRYVVRIPVRPTLPDLTATRVAAIRSLLRSERKFQRDEQFCNLYRQFMSTYEELTHMTRVPTAAHTAKRVCYLPHHGVLKESSTSTRLRVVFNGSWTIPSGTSLNEHLLVGQNLLPALSDILLRWRWHRIVVAADIEKMYKQILVHEDDRDLQRIMWRNDNNIEIAEFKLNTVTYGLACAPFLALRSLQQLARDEAGRFPVGSMVLLNDVYVDDVLTGAETIGEAQELQNQVTQLCMAGGFPLKKWASNCERLLENVPEEDRMQCDTRSWRPEEVSHSILGLHWNPVEDSFAFVVKPPEDDAITKRTILSQTAQLYDPLGWLTPVTIKAKILIQSAWLLGLDWDDSLPDHEAAEWRRFRDDLPVLAQLRIRRTLARGTAGDTLALHGFADASERAYAAVLYLQTRAEDGRAVTSLVTAKSKVAPIKQITLPRLELCAALLLARLVNHTAAVLQLQTTPTFLWTDSMVTLGWIQGHPSKWKTYVANRVAEIQRLTPEARWNHLPGDNNPADCASRGLHPRDLEDHRLWWEGPAFLRNATAEMVETTVDAPTDCDQEQSVMTMAATTDSELEEHHLLARYSTLHKLLRITAWVRRWLPGCGTSATDRIKGQNRSFCRPLTAAELEEAERLWIRWVQAVHFKRELKLIESSQNIQNKSLLTGLLPYLDNQRILRVGGRIRHASLSRDEKHPIILPPSSRFTELMAKSCHKRSLHGGVQLTLALVRQRFWIPRGRRVVKKCLHRCVSCVRWRAATSEQRMGDLPRPRVTPTRPFQSAGVDYAGPVFLRTSPGRGHKATKAFLVIFVCLSTKAVHLDVASNYTAEAFIAAFRRFVSRRGLCTELFSDCGTNFVGADKELRRLFTASSKEGQYIAAELASSRVQWRFNPPAAPHFGGLWEAAVKATKHHLRRVIGDTTLTYEEMATLLSQVEACLNSRPLCPLTDDPEDVSALTPGHLLIGAPITALPEPSLRDVPEARLTRWELLQQMREHFWTRWTKEYLQELMIRPKWQKTASYASGQLCLLLHETTPPSKWPLARITAVHPGADGLVRVVTVRTATSEFTRPIAKLVLLPIRTQDETNTTHMHTHNT